MTRAAMASELLQAALGYAARGWKVFPCAPCAKTPATAHGVLDATSDPEQIRRWWAAQPAANIGLACGPSGLYVVDVDAGRDGFATWDRLKREHGIDDYTITSLTGGGGLHLVYAAPAGVALQNTTGKLGPGVDTRANGGYVVAPPSMHPSGSLYTWDDRLSPDRLAPAPLPAALLALLREAARPAPAPARHRAGSNGYAAAALRAELETLARAAEGARNDRLNRAAFALGQLVGGGELGRAEVEAALAAAAVSIGLGAREAEKTIQSGLDAGGREPRRGPEPRGNGHEPRGDGPEPESGPSAGRPQGSAAPAKQVKRVVPTDDELAQRWIDDHPNTAYGLGEFRRYADGVWPELSGDAVKQEVKLILQTAKAERVRPTARLLASVLELGRVEVAVPVERWDADRDVLVLANGVLQIPSRTLRPHSPDDYATTRLPFAYDPGAAAPGWQKVLARCPAGVEPFLQEFAGYALTTDTRHELAVWFQGEPGSGKSTFLAGLLAMLGDRAGLLGLAEIERSRFSLAGLPGRTLVLSTEQPADYLATTYILNAIISGEPVTVDRKFRDPVTIVPRCKVAWAMNELPRVGTGASGLFRRVKIVQFSAIPEAERDPNIKEQVKQEGPGILNWALDGLERLRKRDRFEIPRDIEETTAHFRGVNDVPALFVAEMCIIGPEYRAQGQKLYSAYRDWCFENGHKPLSSTSVAEHWRRLGCEKSLANGRVVWRGIGLQVATVGTVEM